MRRFLLRLILIIILIPSDLYSQVNDAAILSDTPPKLLSEYGFFQNTQDQITVPGVLPYELITSLFSDYADKHRFVYVPEGMIAAYQKNSVFSFPIGSVLIKTFSYEPVNNQISGRHLIETRLLIRKDAGWDALTYVWDEEGQEASLALAGKTVRANYISKEGNQLDIRYRVPNKNQCKECHLENESIVPIGPKPRNLNRDYNYVEGTMNQLEKWMEVKILESYSEKINSVVDFMDTSKPINERARAYLDINCGHCHSPEGSASNSGLYLHLLENREKQLGVFKGPVATGRGSGGLDYSIVPGHPDESILLYRMISDAPDIMMPESGRSVMHKEAVDLIYQWIEGME